MFAFRFKLKGFHLQYLIVNFVTIFLTMKRFNNCCSNQLLIGELDSVEAHAELSTIFEEWIWIIQLLPMAEGIRLLQLF